MKLFSLLSVIFCAALQSTATANPVGQEDTLTLNYPVSDTPVLLANTFAIPKDKVHRSVRSDSCDIMVPKKPNLTLTVKPEDVGKSLTFSIMGNPQFRFVVQSPDQQFSCGSKAIQLYGVPTFSVTSLQAGIYKIFLGNQYSTSAYLQLFVQP